MALEKVRVINDPAYKTGVGKNGKPWTMAQVTTEKNNLTTVFMPVAVGDQLELTWNDQYGNWSAKKVNAQEVAQLEALRKLYELNLAIYKAITGEVYGQQVETVKPAPNVAPTRAETREVTASQLPPEHIEAPVTAEDVDNFDMSTIPF